jgi:hypothetical protein
MPFCLTDVLNGLKYRPTLLKNVGLCVPDRNFGDFSLFKVSFKRRNCSSARCALATNVIDSDTNIFNGRSLSVNMTN